MRRGPTIRHLLLGVNVIILLAPLGAVVFLQFFDSYLTRQTERGLIHESVLIGEAWRDRLLEDRGIPLERSPEIRPSDRARDRFAPIQPILDLSYGVEPPAEPPSSFRPDVADEKSRAGQAVTPFLKRAQVFTLSGARVLDERGCVVATSGEDFGACLGHLTEVRQALAGSYAAVVRRRFTDQAPPPLTSIRRRSRLRVFTATPIFLDGEVVGAVRMSRTSVAPLEMLWNHRGKVSIVLIICLVVTPAVSYFFSHAISKPVRKITDAADAMARGEPRQSFTSSGLAPREVLKLSDALDRMTEQLTDRADYIAEFASNVSHELKTPLTGITGAVELLQDEWDAMPDAQRRRFLSNIGEGATRMERLVAGLLRLARVQSAPDAAEAIDLKTFLQELLRRFDAPLELDMETAPATLSINREHLEVALGNLVENAIRYRDGKPVEISVAAREDRVVFRVRDRGPGISGPNLSRIFDRFFTTERSAGGTGLGLAIVKAVAETRGGQVDVASGSDGTTFTLVL